MIKSTHLVSICAVALQLLSANFSFAQTLALKPAPTAVTVDGDAKEWGDNLPYSNAKAKISYAIANDKDNLYLVIKTNDAVEQRDILGSGITFSLNTNGKKKADNSITFPTKTEDDQTLFVTMGTDLIQTKTGQSKYQKIHPEGFKDIADTELTPLNPYGIQIAIGYNDAGYLVYEEAIPLALLRADDPAGKEWTFYIKINALENEQKFHKVWTTYFVNKPLVYKLKTEDLALSDRAVNLQIAKVIANGGWSGDKDDKRLHELQSGDLSSREVPSDDITPHINIIKGILLAPSVEFEGKFVLAKIP